MTRSSAARKGAELALATQPELAPIVELAHLVAKGSAERHAASQGQVILIPPDERAGLRIGREKIHVTERKGVTIIQVERQQRITPKELLGLLILAGASVGAYELYESGELGWIEGKVEHPIPGVGTNAIGLKFRNVAGGGGWNPVNYLFG